MNKLSELQQQKAIACVQSVATWARAEQYRVEKEYQEYPEYNEEMEDAIAHFREEADFYDQLSSDLKELFKENK